MTSARAHVDELADTVEHTPQLQPAAAMPVKLDTSSGAELTPELIAARAEEATRQSSAAHSARYHYQLRLAITGRIRFLSHLEMVDTLLGALRRTGVQMALSEGFRPKPKIKVAMPRPVAVEAWQDIVEVELLEDVDEDAFALRLSSVLPAGLELQRIARQPGAYESAASRVVGATWRWSFSTADVEPAQLDAAVRSFLAGGEAMIERHHPKKASRHVDVRQFVGDMSASSGQPPTIRAFIRLTEAGSAKPDEVVRALGAHAQLTLQPVRVTRESITLAEPGSSGGRVAEPAIVGADVPDGPEKPWGAC